MPLRPSSSGAFTPIDERTDERNDDANGVFEMPAPALPLSEVELIVRSAFGLTGTAGALVSERDQNIMLTTDTGRLIVKLANPGEPDSALHLQIAALAHLAEADSTLAVPRIVPALDGKTMVTVTTSQGPLRVRIVTCLDGHPLAESPKTTAVLFDLGSFLGRVTRAFQSFGHPAAHRPEFMWNLSNAQSVRALAEHVTLPEDRELVCAAFERHRLRVLPQLVRLRVGVIHQDANDYNVLVDGERISGLIDFGDMAHGHIVNELAIALAYALLDCDDIVATAKPVITAFTQEFPLDPSELSVLFDLVAARLAMSIAISSSRTTAAAGGPVDPYLVISQAPALRLLRRLMGLRADFLHFAARDAAGIEPVPESAEVRAWLQSPECQPKSIFGRDLRREARVFLQLLEGSPGMEFAGDSAKYWTWLRGVLHEAGARFALGAYGEDRNVYKGDQFRTDAPEPRSVHLGIDLFCETDTAVHAMLDGTVKFVVDNAARYDYGPTVILEHCVGSDGPVFYVLYGHLSRRTLTLVEPGQMVKAGEVVGFVGDDTVNGGWAPHVHVQLITDLLDSEGNFEGAGEPSRWTIWQSLSPDPNMLLRLSPESFKPEVPSDSAEALMARRSRRIGPSLSTSYRRKLHMVRGEGTYLFDHRGRGYLDLVNNVCHVGHANPRVVKALADQASALNTNTRYLHTNMLDLADRLVATLPDPLSVVYFVNSGSEANELALRMARTVTGREDVICLDWAYHGNTAAVIDVSPYKFNRAGGSGPKPYVHITPLADPYRGPFAGYGPESGHAYAKLIDEQISAAHRPGADSRGPAAFIAESISGCGGQVVYPEGFLRESFDRVRAAGGLCIADEVQVGLGRVGTSMWAYEMQGATADIVTIGKPFGNGHPLGAVVTTPDVALRFANGMEYFNTFGGNPVSCAVGLAVLDVIESEGLPANALDVGSYALDRLRALQDRFECIGDVRGQGLYIGVDLVTDRESKAPATTLAADIANGLRDRGILISTDGPADNVLKIKPPIVISRSDIDVFIAELDATMSGLS